MEYRHERTTNIRLLLADVDGTLVTQDKVLTDQTVAVAQQLRERHHAGDHQRRPPRGMSMLMRRSNSRGYRGFQRRVFVNPNCWY